MDITDVPFAEHNGIKIDENNSLSLPFDKRVQNHLSGVHAGAQFLLAESASGYYLLTAFPELIGKINPLLRESNIKFYKQAYGQLLSHVVVSDEAIEKLLKSIKTRGRAVIDLVVEITDENNITTCSGSFRWFVQLKAE